MMDGMELVQQLNYELDQAEACAAETQGLGREKAEAEREYRVALSKTMLRLRSDGIPATIIGDVCRGIPEIAELRCKRDCAEADWEANREAHYLHRQRAEMYRDIIKVEWARQ